MGTKNEENWLVFEGLWFMDNESRWNQNYEALKQWTLEYGHFPNRAKLEG